MLKRLLSLTLLYSLLTFSIAGPTSARTLRRTGNKSPVATRPNKSSCLSCSATERGKTLADRIDSLATIGRTTQIHPLLPVHRSIFAGLPVNFVSSATGSLGFAVNDLGLSGTMPVIFHRVYASDRPDDCGLGKGWSFIFDDRIAIDGETATLTTGDGSVVAFHAEDRNGRFVLTSPEPQTHKAFDKAGDTITELMAGLTRLYRKVGNVYRLAQITDANRNSINMGFDASGNLNQIASNSGTLTLEWSNAKHARLLAVTDSTGRRVRFKYDGQGLRTTTDAEGNEWAYEYSAAGLTRATDPVGRILLRARYDQGGRVVEAGDGAGANTFEYDSTSGSISRRTVVTDSLGVQTVYEHNAQGALIGINDDRGQTLLQITYNAANHPTTFLTQQNATNFQFDAQNRLSQSMASDGSSTAYTFDERGRISSVTQNGLRKDYTRDPQGNVLAASSTDRGQSYKAAHDERGRLLTLEVDGQRTTYEYDNAGNQVASTNEKGGRLKTERDTAGRIVKESYPSGLTVQYVRNNRGIVTKKSDSHGRFVRFETDSTGAFNGFVKSDNTWLRATRDDAGRIVALTSSSGAFRRFGYNSRGGLIDFSDSNGSHKRFNYDRRGRLESILDQKGNKTAIKRDEKGAIERITVFRSEGWQYDYDRKGQLVATRQLYNSISKAAQFLTIGYGPLNGLTATLTANLQGLDCPFGPDPSFDASEQGWDSCWDPFGGFGALGTGGCDLDPFGFGVDYSLCTSIFETPEQCTARQNRICQNARDACGATAVSAALAAGAACIILLDSRPEAAALCLAAVYLKLLGDLGSCDLAYQNCRLRIPDLCLKTLLASAPISFEDLRRT